MKKRTLGLLLLAFVATMPARAITRGCTSAMVSLGLCRTTSDAVMCIAVSTVDPDNGGPRLAPSVIALDAIAGIYDYRTPTSCTQEMVNASICSAGQLGTSVAVTKAQFADMIHRRWVLEQIKQYRRLQERTAADVTVETEPAPDVGN